MEKLLVHPTHLLLILIFTLATQCAGVSCDSSENAIEVKYNVSRDAVLACTVKNLGGRRIIWRRISDPYPISIGNAKFSPSTKYRLMSRGDTSTLFIRRVGRGDAGEYLCEASGGAGPKESVILTYKAESGVTYFLPTEREVVAAIGDTVLLPCHVENMQDRIAVWKNERNEILSVRKKELLGDRRYRVRHDIRVEWSMQIKGVLESDFGYYTCLVNTNPVITRTVELKNSEPARFSPILMEDTHFRRRMEVKVGEIVTLICNFQAYPPAEVRWYKRVVDAEGKMTKISLGKGSKYTLRAVSSAEAGDYICTGNNGMGRPSRGKTKLIVKVPPTTPAPITTTTQLVPTGPVGPHLYHVNPKVGQRRGRNAIIECVGIGQPRPRLEWRFHGKQLANNYKYNIVRSSEGPHRAILKLEIRNVLRAEFGEYECVGHNRLGLVRTSFEVYELS